MHLAPTVGGFLCSALLAGNVYDIRGVAHSDPYGTCFGPDCYRWDAGWPLDCFALDVLGQCFFGDYPTHTFLCMHC